MSDVQKRQKKLSQEFEKTPSWEEKYKKIIQQGKELKPLDRAFQTKDYLVQGCQSQLWLHTYVKNHKVYFEGQSDALITQGLLALMISIYSDSLPKEILESDEEFIKEIGLSNHLSPSRTNGVFSLIRKIKYYAHIYNCLEK